MQKKNKSLLIIGFVWPEPNSTAAGSRMLQLIAFFQKNDYSITMVSTAAKNSKSFNLEELGIQTHEIKLNDSNFDLLIKSINPNVVLFDRFLTEEQFGWRIAENCPNALRILDTEDLHFLRHARHLAYKNRDKKKLNYLVNDLTKRELASIYRCDISLIISQYEMELLATTFKVDTSILLYLPFLLEKINRIDFSSYPNFHIRKNFMSIGNFKHEPNWNAVVHLKNEIWPLIRKELPNTQLHIYGSYPTEKVNQLHNEKEGFIIKGWIENKEEAFINSRICLAPLQFGAGLKGKLIDAMIYGTPSVTTQIGAEAMFDNLPWNGFITDDPKEFCNNAVDLYSDESIWSKAQQNGINIINQCYDKAKYESLFLTTINQTKEDLNKHRLRNFIGSMLHHHTMQSTKYLSKWIEEKNTN